MKEIIEYLKYDRSFDKGCQLYQRFGRNKSMMHALNLQGESPSMLEKLHYQLYKISSLTEAEFNAIMRQPVLVQKADEPPPPPLTMDDIPEDIKKTMRLRDDFPFLKSPDCPDKMKILVADMLTAYDKFNADHEHLFSAANEEQLAELSQSVVENYLENKEIMDELIHYRDTGEILGKHEIFGRVDREKEIKEMDQPSLIKLMSNLKPNISKHKKWLKEQPDHKETANRKSRLMQYEWELELVNSLLKLD